ncbi:cytochrome P450 2J2 isoform X1 [Parasteatoda tepidariorum]|uniref:cytochrome P450 2J2 isoform X1 n=1 Tax=Parasteatoda tepidariorum TaxID=114398 RepID=UPI001C720E7A|nr:cytochrome P450 2C15 isoform X1 [Parasteatoda tepidariorum]XP_042906031.1 cytochrome P450 2C15 isoform X1 [Parasteatoda tepidariorum]
MEFLKEALFFASSTISSISLGVASASLILGYILAASVYYILRDYGVPPGPTGVPILGWWPFIVSEHSHLQQLELKKKYGDIFSFRITGALYINLASQKILREAHITKTDNFRERTPDFNLLARIFEDGVVYSRGEKWQTVRRYFLTQFRDRGMTLFKENTADVADETVCSLVEDLRKCSKEPVDILRLLVNKSNRMIRNTLLGISTPVTEEDISSIQEEYRQVSQIVHSKNMLLHGTFARYFIAPYLHFYKEAMKLHSKVKSRFQKMIDDHRRTYDEDNIRDIIDAYMNEKNLRRSKGDETYQYFTDETLVSNLLQFVGDGVVNVATYVTFMLMALLDHPEEQEKIYKELVEVCGEDRNPTMADKSKLRYFNAFLLEAQRLANFIPLFPSLECTKETTVGGYRIPKGAITVTNVYAIHNDPNVYEDPDKFNPSRFLGVDGKPREELPITFGVGKRVCLGEGFVLMQTFVYLAAIIKNFKISYQEPKTYFEVVMSRKLKICVTPRK